MSALSTLARTEARLFVREPASLFWIVAFPPLLLGILGAVPAFRRPSQDLGGLRVVDLYVPVTILLSAIMAGVQTMPAVLAGYREQRVLRRIATTPARPWQLLAAQYVLHAAAVAVGALLVSVLGLLALDVRVPGSAGAYVLVLVLALAACLAAGGVISGLAPSGRAATTVGTVVFLPMMFTAGVWVPVRVMPGLLGDVVGLTPMGAAALALDQAAAGSWPALSHLAVLAGWTAALGAAAARCFRWQ